MDVNDLITVAKWFAGIVGTGAVGVLVAVVKQVLSNKDRITDLEHKVESSGQGAEEAKIEVKELETKINKIETTVSGIDRKVDLFGVEMVSKEKLRTVIDEVLTKRDNEAERHRHERDARMKLEIKTTVHEEIDKLLPKLLQMIKGDTSIMGRKDKRDHGPGSGGYQKP